MNFNLDNIRQKYFLLYYFQLIFINKQNVIQIHYFCWIIIKQK